MSTKRFTDEFKIEAVSQVVDKGYRVAMVAQRPGLIVTFILVAVTGLPSLATAANRCTDGQGRVTFQDAPCPGAGPAAPTADRRGTGSTVQPDAAGGYSTARGTWRGPMQLHIVEGTTRDLGAHRVAPMVIALEADGKVQGVIPELGCKLSGLTSTFASAASATVDVTLTGCDDRRLNTRMRGQLFAHAGAREAKLNLTSTGSILPHVAMTRVTVQAVLRR